MLKRKQKNTLTTQQPSELTAEMRQAATRVCAETALSLLKNGAESALIIESCKRIGYALGVDKVECLTTTNGIIVTTIFNNNCITTVRRCHSQGVNFAVILQLQHLVINTERNGATPEMVYTQLTHIHQKRYDPLFTAFMVAISCACFARLAGGDAIVMLVTFIAALIGMRVRQFLHHRHFNIFIIFIASAFASTMVTTTAFHYNLGNDPHYAIASAVLLLVPGVPLINAFSDILKGYMNMGIGRWFVATEMALGACIGMALAMSIWHINLMELVYG